MRHLRFEVSVIVLVFAVSGCAPVTPTAPPDPVPRVMVTPERRDLGEMGLGEDTVAEFVVRNEGGAPLSLATPVLPLGTRVEGLVPELSPGESIHVRFMIDTLNANAQPQQDWTLVTNDPDRPNVVVPVRVDVRPFLLARPGYARYNTVQKAREGTIAQTIGAADGATFRIVRIDSPAPFLRVSFHEALPNERREGLTGSQWRVVTTLPADAPVGALTGTIVIHTDHLRQKRAFIPLSGFVRPIMTATPPEARLGDLDRRRARSLRMFLKNFAEELIEVTGVSTDVSAVRAEIEPIERGRSWRLLLFPVGEAPLGPFSGHVLVKTASPKVPTFEIPLNGRLVEASRPE